MAYNPDAFGRAKFEARTAASVPNPIAGTVALFLDSSNGHLSQKDSAGTVIDLAAGGGSVSQTTLTVPAKTYEYYEQVVTDASVTTTTRILASLVGELDAENDLESLQDDNMNVYAVAEAGQIRFILVGTGAFIGDFKVNYQEY